MPVDACFKCGKKVTPQLSNGFMAKWEEQKPEDTDSWVKFDGWLELFLDPEIVYKNKDSDNELWFVALCPDCVDLLASFLVPKTTTEAKQ